MQVLCRARLEVKESIYLYVVQVHVLYTYPYELCLTWCPGNVPMMTPLAVYITFTFHRKLKFLRGFCIVSNASLIAICLPHRIRNRKKYK